MAHDTLSELELFAELEAELESILVPNYELEGEAEFFRRFTELAKKALRVAAVTGAIATAPLLPPDVHRQVVRVAQVITGTRDPKDEKRQIHQLPEKPVAGASPPPKRKPRQRRQRELEAELESALLHLSPTTLMESLGYAATTAETEAEAIAFIQTLPALTAKLYPQVASLVKTASPSLKRGLTVATRSLYREPRTRPLIQVMPTVLGHTLSSLKRQQQQGAAIMPDTVAKQLINQAHRVLGHPQPASQTLQRSKAVLQRTAIPSLQVRDHAAAIRSVL